MSASTNGLLVCILHLVKITCPHVASSTAFEQASKLRLLQRALRKVCASWHQQPCPRGVSEFQVEFTQMHDIERNVPDLLGPKRQILGHSNSHSASDQVDGHKVSCILEDVYLSPLRTRNEANGVKFGNDKLSGCTFVSHTSTLCTTRTPCKFLLLQLERPGNGTDRKACRQKLPGPVDELQPCSSITFTVAIDYDLPSKSMFL